MANDGTNPGPIPTRPDILDAIAAASKRRQLPLPGGLPSREATAEDEVLSEVLDRVIEQNRRRASRESEGLLKCFTIKIPVHELAEICELCSRLDIKFTDYYRFPADVLKHALKSPVEKNRAKIETIREEVEARRAKAVIHEAARRNPTIEMAS